MKKVLVWGLLLLIGAPLLLALAGGFTMDQAAKEMAQEAGLPTDIDVVVHPGEKVSIPGLEATYIGREPDSENPESSKYDWFVFRREDGSIDKKRSGIILLKDGKEVFFNIEPLELGGEIIRLKISAW